MYYKVKVYAKEINRSQHKFVGEYLIEYDHKRLKAFKRNWSQGLFIVEVIGGVEGQGE